jgi:nicotinate-nucleotide pyrophosphorylase (carboxylating)
VTAPTKQEVQGPLRAAAVDIRDEILRGVTNEIVVASIVADEVGVVAGSRAVVQQARKLELVLERVVDEGTRVGEGDEIARFRGVPKQVLMAEDLLVGLMAKPSGIATATRAFVDAAGARPRIVSGAWKKMPASQKDSIRQAVVVGGASFRVCDEPFVYLDKNYIRVLGGIKSSLYAVRGLTGRTKVVQLKGHFGDIASESIEAVRAGAGILHVDTGEPQDAQRVSEALSQMDLRGRVKIAFGGGVRMEQMDRLKALDIDILDIGRGIVDAPLLDMRMDVVEPSALGSRGLRA